MVLTRYFEDLDALTSACSPDGLLEVVLELLI